MSRGLTTYYASSTAGSGHLCNCIGPQNGQPLCPCAMRNVTVENGRYVRKEDLGPAPDASKALHREYSEFNRLMGREE